MTLFAGLACQTREWLLTYAGARTSLLHFIPVSGMHLKVDSKRLLLSVF